MYYSQTRRRNLSKSGQNQPRQCWVFYACHSVGALREHTPINVGRATNTTPVRGISPRYLLGRFEPPGTTPLVVLRKNPKEVIMTSPISTVIPEITIHDNRPVTTSVSVANFFGKQHKNVIQRLETLDCSPTFNRLNFQPVEYTDAKGENRPAYEMTKDGFVFLVMGFTGKKAAAFKEAYIAEFNRMEEEIRQQKNDMIFGDSRTLVIHLDEHGNIKSTEKVPDDSVVCTFQSFKFWVERNGWLVIRRDDLTELFNETLRKIGLPAILTNPQ
ncbi:Rha family transcriptional regulator [Salmonella enterica]|nr:Rha family transcriptional regulator [Salmonella enterica]EKF6403644.1 Rha family transcriptional regulator [Salmonella enterica]